jgi:hypothetical protein
LYIDDGTCSLELAAQTHNLARLCFVVPFFRQRQIGLRSTPLRRECLALGLAALLAPGRQL